MGATFAERWLAGSERVGGPVCVGLDPVFGRLPAALRGGVDERDREAVAEAFVAFCDGVIDAVHDVSAAVKPQLACFERCGAAGVAAYERVVAHAKSAGLLVIADAKRGDIGVSAQHYAAAFLEGDHAADAVTVSPYLGPDTLEPFIETANANGRAVFVLVRTSNPGSGVWQGMETADASRVVDHVADYVERQSDALRGGHSYGPVGAVVGATHPREAAALRQRMPHVLFLVPGYGAQGGGAEDVRACLHGVGHGHDAAAGTGAIVTASRSVIYAEPKPGRAWSGAVRDAATAMRDELAAVIAG